MCKWGKTTQPYIQINSVQLSLVYMYHLCRGPVVILYLYLSIDVLGTSESKTWNMVCYSTVNVNYYTYKNLMLWKHHYYGIHSHTVPAILRFVCFFFVFTYLILRKLYTNHNLILLQRRFTQHVTEGMSLSIRAVKRNDGVCCNSLTRSWYSNPSLHGNVAFSLHKEQAICQYHFFFDCPFV